MVSLLELAASHPPRTLEHDEVLIRQGGTGGSLFILEDGELAVERDGVAVTSISSPNALVGEMSVLLGTPNSATVRSVGRSTIRPIDDARAHLLKDPELTLRLASLVAGRLDATTALLVDLAKEHPGKTEQGLLARIFAALTLPESDVVTVTRHDLFG